MIYQVLWITAKPHNRMNGMAHLKKLAELIQGDHGIEANVLTSVVRGPANVLGLVTSHDSLDAMIKVGDAIGQADSLGEWSAASEPFLDLSSSEWGVYRVHKRNGTPQLQNFVQVISVSITPGQISDGRAALGEFADYLTENHSCSAEVLSLEGGAHYRYFVAIYFNDLAQYEAVWAAFEADEAAIPISDAVMASTDLSTMEKNIARYL